MRMALGFASLPEGGRNGAEEVGGEIGALGQGTNSRLGMDRESAGQLPRMAATCIADPSQEGRPDGTGRPLDLLAGCREAALLTDGMPPGRAHSPHAAGLLERLEEAGLQRAGPPDGQPAAACKDGAWMAGAG